MSSSESLSATEETVRDLRVCRECVDSLAVLSPSTTRHCRYDTFRFDSVSPYLMENNDCINSVE
jgi:predicted nucleic acid binding AN1-type Zn finger protein